jgi:hypothetical protein
MQERYAEQQLVFVQAVTERNISLQSEAMRKEVFGLVSEAIANVMPKPNDNERHDVC